MFHRSLLKLSLITGLIVGFLTERALTAEVALGSRAQHQQAPSHTLDTLLADPDADGAIRAFVQDPNSTEAVLNAIRDRHTLAQELVGAIKQAPVAPDHLAEGLIGLLDEADADVQASAARALGRWATMRVTGALIDRLGRDPLLEATTERSIMLGLRRTLALTESSGPAQDDPASWAAWWDDARASMDELAWTRAVADRHRSLASTHAARLEEGARLLQRTYQRLYATLPEEERSSLIDELASSERSLLRSLGYEMALRALLNARPLGETVRRRAARGAEEVDVELRRKAAVLLERLGVHDEDIDRASAWLASEADPETVASLLRLCARERRMHSHEVALAALRALAVDDRRFDPALEAVLALHASDVLTEDEVERVAAIAEHALATEPSELAIRAVNALGDRALLLGVLRGQSDLRVPAARALSSSPAYVDQLTETARGDDRLFVVASEALVLHRPVAESLALLLALPAPDPELLRERGAALVRAMDVREQARAIEGVSNESLRAALLSHAGVRTFHTEVDTSEHTLRADLSLELARALLAVRDPAGALHAIEAVPEERRRVEHTSARAHALLWLGRLDEAHAITVAGVGASTWLDALRDAIDLTHAEAIARGAQSLFADRFTEQERRRYESLVSRLARSEETAPPPPADDPGTG